MGICNRRTCRKVIKNEIPQADKLSCKNTWAGLKGKKIKKVPLILPAPPMSVTFWFTAALALSWLSYRFLRMRMLNNIEPNRRRLLDSLGDFNFDVDPLFLGFFHPYCNAGGGGERVLWTAIRDIQREFPHAICVVYTGDTLVSKEQMLFKAKKNFNIELNPRSLAIVYLHTRYLVEDSRYPRFTLILQSLASMIMGYEAISQFVPDLFFGESLLHRLRGN
ncbi:hypothetical protein BX666DRAFT_199052 [Dichotomocladium elegans]|nr:hypothetical protein BX666DRAFT_199052 [Dichotomocladium elegans]